MEMAMTDQYDLARFLTAQNSGDTYDRAVAELRRGRKTSHWMWFVFPQIAGLGQSAISRTYAISSLAEAKAFLRHPVLGSRLIDCSAIVAALPETNAARVFGGIDAQKLQSSMTLFRQAAPQEPVFQQVLDHYFGGATDSATDERI